MIELTPLLQLNLFVHMSLEYPEQSGFYPYLREKGYVIKAIEASIPVNPKNYNALSKHVKVNQIVTPEMILEHNRTGELMLLECKVNSFDVDFEHTASKQAIGYLSLEPDYLAEFMGTNQNREAKAHLIYATDEEYADQLRETLGTLQEKTINIIGDSLDYEVLGMEISEEGCFIVKTSSKGLEKIKITNYSALQKGAVLYIVPFEPNSKIDEYGKVVLERQVRNSLRVFIGKYIGYQEFSFNSTTICEDINPVWSKLPSYFKKKIRRLVHNYILDVARELNHLGLKILAENQVYRVPMVDRKIASRVRRFLLSEKFVGVGEENFNELEQLTIDDFLAENTEIEAS
ncbi:hypothetical protein [Ectobacillus antri]|uniref:hypothetical protein n=1 Tax=Ectobacillus antri TaxID=2486280 RepID=UPI000F5B1E06|nr:hypothetical protein [Ectobacillus antri]